VSLAIATVCSKRQRSPSVSQRTTCEPSARAVSAFSMPTYLARHALFTWIRLASCSTRFNTAPSRAENWPTAPLARLKGSPKNRRVSSPQKLFRRKNSAKADIRPHSSTSLASTPLLYGIQVSLAAPPNGCAPLRFVFLLTFGLFPGQSCFSYRASPRLACLPAADRRRGSQLSKRDEWHVHVPAYLTRREAAGFCADRRLFLRRAEIDLPRF
jgi:hypothetical protein